jgi:hypothetical protein
MWAGLAVTPAKGDWSLLHNHVRDNLCNGVEEYCNWLMTWLAQMVQFPGEKMGTSLLLKGKRGTGKSTLCDWMRVVFGEHACKVNDPSQFLGTFNALLSGIVFLTAEEAFFAGDVRAGAVMKDVLTSDTMNITFKHADSEVMENHLHVAMVTNEDWAVPASLKGDERRFFVLDVSDKHMQDIQYFGAIRDQMRSGGVQAMLRRANGSSSGWSRMVKPWFRASAMPLMTAWN